MVFRLASLYITVPPFQTRSQKRLIIPPLIMSALARFIASVGVIASSLVVSFSPVPAHAQCRIWVFFCGGGGGGSTPAIPQLLWEVDTGLDINEVVFSPDGKTLITGSDVRIFPAETLTMWDVDTGEKIAAIEGWDVNSVALSPDGKMIAAGYDRDAGYDRNLDYINLGYINLWDVATQAHVATFEGHDAPVFSVDFSLDGTMLVSGSDDGTIRLWDTATGDNVASSEWAAGDIFAVWEVQFSPDGTMIAGVGSRQIKVWDAANLATGQEIITLQDDTRESPLSVRFSPDGTMLAAGYENGAVRLWDVATESRIVTFEGHDDDVEAVDFSPDGKVLISASLDHTVRLWDVAATGDNVASIEWRVFWVSDVKFSPDGSLFATGERFGHIKLWDASAWITTTTAISDDTLPTEVSLAQNYPNPFNPATTIGFELPMPTDVRLDVYDMTGRQLSTLVNGIYPSGYHTVQWNAIGLPTGIYVYRLTTGGKTITQTMTLMR